MKNPEPEFRAVPTDLSQELADWDWQAEEDSQLSQISLSSASIDRMAEILNSPDSTDEEKQRVVEELSHIASDQALEVLRRNRLRCYLDDEAEVEIAIESAEHLHSAHLGETPLFQCLIQICEEVQDELGGGLDRSVYKKRLAEKFNQVGLDYRQDCRAVLRYYSALISEVHLDFIIDDTILVGVMGSHEQWADEEDGDSTPPRRRFYSDLRIANLPKGLLADFSHHIFDWRAMYNVDIDRGLGVVGYEILMQP